MSDRWNQALLVVLLLGHFLLLATQPRTQDTPLERLLLRALAPLGQSVSIATGSFGEGRNLLQSHRSLREENLALRTELEVARRQLLRLHSIEGELERLSRISGYTPEATSFFVANVVYMDSVSTLRTMVLYTGSAAPRHNQPVVTEEGLVGRVVIPSGRYAKVQLVTDRAASVSAMIERTRRKGVVRGTDHTSLELDFIPQQADVQVGDRLVTAGIDGVFPRDILIGTVTSVAPGTGLFHRIEVRPAVDFRLLDQVYVLTQETLPSEAKEALADGLP